MGKLQRYILRSYLVAATLTALVLTFVLSVGFLFQVFRFIVSGVRDPWIILKFLGASFPEVLGFTIPLSLMIASLLVFGRLSTDSEIAAMKACGVSFWAIMRGPIIVALAATGIAFYLQNYAMPNGHFLRRTIANELAVSAGDQMVEPGYFIDEMDDFTFFCTNKTNRERDIEGKKELYTTMNGVMAIDRRAEKETGMTHTILAEEAEMHKVGSNLVFTLRNVIISPPYIGTPDTKQKDVVSSTYGTATQVANPMAGKIASAKTFTYTVKDAVTRAKKYVKKPKDFNLTELNAAIAETTASLEKLYKDKEMGIADPNVDVQIKGTRKYQSHLRFLRSYRMVWAISCLCFVLVGVPLGCQAQRKESSRGMVMGLVIGLTFFLFILLSESLAKTPSVYPWLLVWTPAIICIGTALKIIPKHQ
ncbi:MAG: LptF/LptG family permease [bacterium]|nr:LptF/LptG family permease [bacterium]